MNNFAKGDSVNAIHTICQPFCAAAVLGLFLAGCDNEPQVREAYGRIPETEEPPVSNPKTAEARVVRGLLRHSPQDVKNTDAWLGQEFAVGETPILASEAVSHDELMRMVGKQVEIEGIWNEGTKWEPPKPSEEESLLQAPSFPDEVTIMRGTGIEATLIKEIGT